MRFGWIAFAGITQAFALSNPPDVDYITDRISSDDVHQIAVDPAGYAYVAGIRGTGRCTSTLGSQSQSLSVVTKIQPDGQGYVWTMCMPGVSAAVALDNTGSVYFASSLDQSTIVTKLDPIDGKVISSTPIPSAQVYSMAVDRTGNVYMTGRAKPGLPTTPGAYKSDSLCSSTESFCGEAFVVKVAATGAIQYATYTNLRGVGNSIAVDSRGEVWITGFTDSLTTAPPSSFVVKLDSTGGKRLFFNSFGSGFGLGIAVDSKDAAYALGYAFGEITATPGTVQPNRPVPDSTDAGYVVKIDSTGKTVYATYVGQGHYEISKAITVDDVGNAYLGLNAEEERVHCGPARSKLTVLNADASQILTSRALTFNISAIALDGRGGLYFGGTGSSVFLATKNEFLKSSPSQVVTAFVGKLDFSKPAGPQLGCVVNAASLAPGRNRFGIDGSIAPGEVISIFGVGLTSGPDLGVTVGGLRAPILYADSEQINCIVPLELIPGTPQVVSVNNAAGRIGAFYLYIAPRSPGLFRLNGQLAALNEDGSINSTANPAKPGSIVTLFLTGAGSFNLKIGDGELGPLVPPFPTPVLGVAVRIWSPLDSPGQQAEVLFAGQAPGVVAGVVQLNLRIPENAKPGKAGIIVLDYFPTGEAPGIIEVR